jgi:hypothetical protein
LTDAGRNFLQSEINHGISQAVAQHFRPDKKPWMDHYFLPKQ